ncbi:MAG: hypothetical protein PF637_06040 [Spirochaetes bacterium]|jgi:hypothetical protein|nr:hypothetical protein [Spirochaetota bacterium]
MIIKNVSDKEQVVNLITGSFRILKPNEEMSAKDVYPHEIVRLGKAIQTIEQNQSPPPAKKKLFERKEQEQEEEI